jgi:pyruvate dehydrogenase E1 component alpha subunit
MHLADFSVGAMVSNAIVGANIPIATGAAMAFRLQKQDRVAVSFFGDGASNIGAFHEGINFAAVQNAPVLFVCENNLYAASTHISKTSRVTDIAERAKAYGIPGYTVDGMDFNAVYQFASEAVDRARVGDGPTLLECKTYRYRGHSRGDPCGYRNEEEFKIWSQRDPIELMRMQLQREFTMSPKSLAEIEQECQAEVEAAVQFAIESPEPPETQCRTHVFVSQ